MNAKYLLCHEFPTSDVNTNYAVCPSAIYKRMKAHLLLRVVLMVALTRREWELGQLLSRPAVFGTNNVKSWRGARSCCKDMVETVKQRCTRTCSSACVWSVSCSSPIQLVRFEACVLFFSSPIQLVWFEVCELFFSSPIQLVRLHLVSSQRFFSL